MGRTRLTRVEPALRRALRGAARLPSGARVLVAVSGGADSTALLAGLVRVAGEFDLQLHAAHLHHGLRAESADGDRAHVRAMCISLGIPLTDARWNTKLRMKRRGLHGQAGLRTLRRAFLVQTARKRGCDAIATAHTADDQLETLLMRLARGTGLPGLAGMHPKRGRWIKPLLELPRASIETDLARAGIAWREDESNQDLAYVRNRVRHRVVPSLIEATGRDRSALALAAGHAAREVQEAASHLEVQTKRVLSSMTCIERGGIDLDSRPVARCPDALQRAALRALWRRAAGVSRGLERRHLELLLGLLARPSRGAVVALPGGWSARHEGHVLRLARGTSGPIEWSLAPGPGTYGCRTISGRMAMARLRDKSLHEECFAEDAVAGKLELRAGNADEWFSPFGVTRPIRLGAFLRRQRVSMAFRSRPAVLSDSGGILWVVGVRRSNRAPVTTHTEKALWINVEPA